MATEGAEPDALYGSEELPICDDFHAGEVRFLGDTGVSVSIIVMNIILTLLTTNLVDIIGFTTHS